MNLQINSSDENSSGDSESQNLLDRRREQHQNTNSDFLMTSQDRRPFSSSASEGFESQTEVSVEEEVVQRHVVGGVEQGHT